MPDWRTILIASFAMGFIPIITPIFTETIFADLIPILDCQGLATVAQVAMVAGFTSAALNVVRSIALLRFSVHVDMFLESAMLARVLALPTKFFRQFTSGNVAARMQGLSSIQTFLAGETIGIVFNFVFGFWSLGLMCYYSVKLTGMVLLIRIIYALISGFIMKVVGINQNMKRSALHILQPHCIENFFVTKFNGRYEITRVPAAIRNKALKGRFAEPIAESYKRICFAKKNCHIAGEVSAILLEPMNPLLNAVSTLTLEKLGDTLKQGTIFIDDNDCGKNFRLLFYVEVKFQDGRCETIAKRLHFVGRLRFIEVKGRTSEALTVTVSKNEILTALNSPENFILAIITVEGNSAHVVYIKKPFTAPPDFNAVSVNYKISSLMRQGKILLDRNIFCGGD